MLIDVYGDGLRLLEHFIRYSMLYPERLADAMGYNLDGFVQRLHHLDKAYQEGAAGSKRNKTERSKKEQPPLPVDFDCRFPDSVGAKVREWLTYKTERKDFYSPTGLRNLLSQIDNQVKDHSVELVVDLISECMANNWAGIIWDRIERQGLPSNRRRGANSANKASLRLESPWTGFSYDN